MEKKKQDETKKVVIVINFLFFISLTEISYCVARPVGTEERSGCCPAALCFWQHHSGPALPASSRGGSSSSDCPEDEA